MRYNTPGIVVSRLLWDPWNVGHMARHQVSPEEVEEICQGNPLVLTGYLARLIVLGPTAEGRIVAVVLAPQEAGVYYPVTARPASRRERALYRREKGGSGNDGTTERSGEGE